ncbi:hypothetical protein GUJ93_ZPchr0003g18176 [Zizania palustris]|uniref:GTD-binding domain-containing protein n=1 Tax=Zizania palustris TaxID=103762 RepID=A0A8J5RXT0_ZIZPA|nr:hypothetical protein GUJ93_ZPchr0003g18176 [Zizania palustris]KAG8062292.1 hypothetical protein GUJ93_ZPchr0003g18176 [Zizania palustris]
MAYSPTSYRGSPTSSAWRRRAPSASRLGVDSLFEPQHQGKGAGAGAEPLRRVLCDGHAAEVSRLGYCGAHRRLADAGDMCEDCASVAASGKALLSWMRRSELGERDLACGCCGVTLESGFFSPPFLLPTPAACDMDRGHKRDASIATLNGDVVFVSEEGPVLELFDEKPLLEDDSIVDMAAPCSEIVGNVEQLVPLESADSSVRMSAVSSQSHGEGKEAIDHGTAEQCDVMLKNMTSTNEEKSVVAFDDEKVGDMVGRMIDEEIAALVVSQASMVDGFNNEIDGETAQGLADQQSSEEDTGLKDKDKELSVGSEISEDEQVDQGAIKQELFSMPINPRVHDFAIDSLEGNTEPVHQAELNNGWNSMPMEAVVHVSETSTEITEEELVQHAELSQESDLMPIYSRKHTDEEDKISQSEINQGLDSVTIDSWEEILVISNEGTGEKQVEQAELKHESTFMTVHVVEFVKDSFDANSSTCNVDSTEAALPSLHLSYGPSTSLDKLCPDSNDIESERALDMLTHIEGIGGLQELPDHRSSVATISTDLKSIELASVDQLKFALATAQKSLSALYAELENERSAASIAADETMAMINRLQEQKQQCRWRQFSTNDLWKNNQNMIKKNYRG